jgi:hypothetical protein
MATRLDVVPRVPKPGRKYDEYEEEHYIETVCRITGISRCTGCLTMRNDA